MSSNPRRGSTSPAMAPAAVAGDSMRGPIAGDMGRAAGISADLEYHRAIRANLNLGGSHATPDLTLPRRRLGLHARPPVRARQACARKSISSAKSPEPELPPFPRRIRVVSPWRGGLLAPMKPVFGHLGARNGFALPSHSDAGSPGTASAQCVHCRHGRPRHPASGTSAADASVPGQVAAGEVPGSGPVPATHGPGAARLVAGFPMP